MAAASAEATLARAAPAQHGLTAAHSAGEFQALPTVNAVRHGKKSCRSRVEHSRREDSHTRAWECVCLCCQTGMACCPRVSVLPEGAVLMGRRPWATPGDGGWDTLVRFLWLLD